MCELISPRMMRVAALSRRLPWTGDRLPRAVRALCSHGPSSDAVLIASPPGMRVSAAESIGISIPINIQLLANGHQSEITRREVMGRSVNVRRCYLGEGQMHA